MTPATNQSSSEKNVITDAYEKYKWEKLKLLKKEVQRSRDTLFLVAGLMMMVALIQLTTGNADDKRAFYLTALLSIVFVAIGFLSRKEPFGALIMALIIYVGLWLVSVAIQGPQYMFSGIVGKIIIIVALASGIPHAYEADQIKKELKESEGKR
jgi:di/tricarboxylate transporter